MKSCSTNDVKIYNLSSGKSLPEWISERKKRQAQKKGDKKSIELIQDFEMPGVSTNIKMSPDGNFILATGIYKPRIKCYDVSNLSMKFERCFDSEIVNFVILSQDYGKLAFLQCDRYVEFHSQFGRYYRTRIPKFGRDLVYHTPSCDLVIVGATNEVYRLNLELGRFSTPLITTSKTINRCVVNPVHHVLIFGTEEGHVEAWDQRTSKRVGVLDTAFSSITESTQVEGIPSVTALAFKDSLTLGVGTATGQVLLYDIRSSKPLLVKDHYYSLPIKNIEFHKNENMVFSMDSKIVKIWDEHSGKPYTAVEEEADFNDLCLIPNTGMFFVANEDKKMLSYYVPTLGPAPRWCSFLDSLAEELEESNVQTIYDDYKFVSERELHDIGLEHLIGTNMLRGYMHGYFVDMRLYTKAKAALAPFNFSEFKKKKIKERLERESANRVKLNTLPPVNKELALKLMTAPDGKKKKKTENLLDDDRFKSMFQNPDFEVDKQAEEYRLLNPALAKMEKRNLSKLETVFEPVDDDEKEGKDSSDEDDEEDDTSSDEDNANVVRQIRDQKRKAREWQQEADSKAKIEPKFYEIKSGEELKLADLNSNKKPKLSRTTLGERVDQESKSEIKTKGPLGSREMTFQMKGRGKKRNAREEALKHHKERRQIRRSAGGLKGKKNSWKKS